MCINSIIHVLHLLSECLQDDEETSTQSVDVNGEGDESGVTQSPGGHDNHPACQPNKFQCPGSGECIWQMWVCDGDEDCDGGEDESDEICQVESLNTKFFGKVHTYTCICQAGKSKYFTCSESSNNDQI